MKACTNKSVTGHETQFLQIADLLPQLPKEGFQKGFALLQTRCPRTVREWCWLAMLEFEVCE